MHYYRLQQANLTIEQMQAHRSIHGVDSDGEIVFVDGVCANDFISTAFGGSCENEVVVLTGQLVERIYDGVVIYPTAIVARHSYDEWCEMVESGLAAELYD